MPHWKPHKNGLQEEAFYLVTVHKMIAWSIKTQQFTDRGWMRASIGWWDIFIHSLYLCVVEHTGAGNIVATFPELAVEEEEQHGLRLTDYFNTTADVKKVLNKHGISYTQDSYTESTDLTGYLIQENTPSVGNLLALDLITMTSKFTESVFRDVFMQVTDLIKCMTRVEKTENGDKHMFDNMVDILAILK